MVLDRHALAHIIDNLSEITRYLDRIRTDPSVNSGYDADQAMICTNTVRRELLRAVLGDVEIEPAAVAIMARRVG